jgi:hypothetical protein
MSITATLIPPIVFLPGMSMSDIDTHVKQLYNAAYRLREFLDGDISEENWLESVEATGLNMDEYLKVAMINSDLISDEIENHCSLINTLK